MAWLGRTFDAVLVDGDSTGIPGRTTSLLGVRGAFERLCAVGVDVAVLSSRGLAELDDRLGARTTGPGRLLLSTDDGAALHEVTEDGPQPQPLRSEAAAGDATERVLEDLGARGVGPGLVLLVVGRSVPWQGPHLSRATVVSVGEAPGLALDRALHLGGGLRMLRALLDEQARRREAGHVPEIDHDPAWVLDVAPDDRRAPHALESLLSLSDGAIGLRGSTEPPSPREAPSLLVAGVYTSAGSAQHLLPGPWPLRPTSARTPATRRRLDLRTGVLLQESDGIQPLRTSRFVVAAGGGVVALREEGAVPQDVSGLGQPPDGVLEAGEQEGEVAVLAAGDQGGVVAVAREIGRHGPGWRTRDRFVAYAGDPERRPESAVARTKLASAADKGFDLLLREHRAAWADRWETACVWIPDDPRAELAVRFALFHLWGLTTDADELAVGARGLSGPGYAGHVFWDADVFVLPALVTMSPRSVRAMLTYRVRRLPAARAAAAERGLAGARLPWECAQDGTDITPTDVRTAGVRVPVLTGMLAEHVVGDVAWAVHRYATWTGDREFLAGPGRPLMVETARYWASRAERDPDGAGHVRIVTGPDEYHEVVDDDVYTNVLARWNLRQGAALTDDEGERREWRDLADALVVRYDPVRRRHEQFAGYDELEPLLMADVAPPPVAADLVLGSERVTASQIIKQPDVLMAHHVLPDEMPPGSLSADLDHYLPRTAHGSSLSPAITASLLASAGRPDEALNQLDIALRLDLDDLTGVTGAGLHLATMGGVWQALLQGFVGLRVQDGCVLLDPRLPTRWPVLRVRLLCLGRVLDVTVRADTVDVWTDGPLAVAAGNRPAAPVTGRRTWVKSGHEWEVMG